MKLRNNEFERHSPMEKKLQQANHRYSREKIKKKLGPFPLLVCNLRKGEDLHRQFDNCNTHKNISIQSKQLYQFFSLAEINASHSDTNNTHHTHTHTHTNRIKDEFFVDAFFFESNGKR